MGNYISVERALKKATWTLWLPSILIFLGAIVVISAFGPDSLHIAIRIPAGMLTGFAFALLYSAVAVTKWRIWAFSRVVDVHELKRAAITEKLIPEEGSWMEKLEIKTKADKKKLEVIGERFSQPFEFFDDPEVGEQSNIFEARTFYFVLGAALILLGVGVAAVSSFWPLAIVIIIAGLTVFLWDSGYLTNEKELPLITMNDKGISTKQAGFQSWEDITNEEVRLVGVGDSAHYEFVFDYPGGAEEFNLNYLKITPRRLNHLLAIYRKRSKMPHRSKVLGR